MKEQEKSLMSKLSSRVSRRYMFQPRSTTGRGGFRSLWAVVVVSAVSLCVGATLLGAGTAQAATAHPMTIAFPVTTIGVGHGPSAVAVNPSTHNVYVANASDGTVSVIDESGAPPEGTVTATIGVGHEPSAVGVDPFAPFPSDNNVYVANFQDNTVSVINESGDALAHTGTVTATIGVGSEPSAVAVDPSTHNVYVTNSFDGTVSVIDESGDAHTGTVTATIHVGNIPRGVAVDPSTHNVYVANDGDSTVSVIDESGDAHSGTVTTTISVGLGNGQFGIAVDPSTHNVYVANDGDSTVSVIDESGDAHSGMVTATIRVGQDSYGVAVDPSTDDIYVTNSFDGTVSVIDESGDAHTGTVIDTIRVGNNPQGVAVDPFEWWGGPTPSHNIYITDQGDSTVSVISPEVSPTLTGTPSAATVGTPYWYQFTVAGSPTPTLTWSSVPSGSKLPLGLTLAQDGTLSGTPTSSGTYTFMVTGNNPLGTASDTVSLTIAPEPEATPTITGTPSAATVGTPYWYQFTVAGFPTPTLTWSAVPPGSKLPPGLTLAQDGTLSGTPTSSGTYTFMVTDTNPLGTASDTVSLTIIRSIRPPNPPPCKPVLCQ